MGKKGRPKTKAKRTGKRRSRGKRGGTIRAVKERKLTKTVDADYLNNPTDCEPVRQDDSDETEGKMDDMEEEDFEIVQYGQTDLKFLIAANLEEDSKHYKKKRKVLENTEESYEKKPRLAGERWNSSQHTLLPIKDSTGIIQQITQLSQNGDSNILTKDMDMSSTTNHEAYLGNVEANVISLEENIPKATLSAVDLLKIRQEKIDAKKVLITNLVSAILEDPDGNVEKLNKMNKLCEDKDSDVSVTVRKLAIVSQLEVFKDIIPGYHIRPLPESEKAIKVSKDVKKIRKFEEGLLKSYQRYLEILEQTAKERKTCRKSQKFPQKDLPIIALNCLCDLLLTVPHFNFHTNIMAVLVPRMNNKSGDEEVSKLCCQTIHSIFKKDSVGEISLEVVKLITKFLKSQSFIVQPCVLETFLSLRLNDADLGMRDNDLASEKPKYKNRLDKAYKKRMSKNDRKRHKELKKIERELQEAEAVEGKQKSRKLQTEIIKLVFFIYFRVLKTSGLSPLLGPVLAGLSKYTHLINVDFFADLMSILQTLIKSEEISYRDKLHCILTAFKIMSGQGEALNIDPQTFYTHLYSALLNISPVSVDSDVIVVFQCLDVMLSKRRKQVSIQRLLAYIKRLCTVSLQQCPAIALGLLACCRSFLQMHSKAGIILDGDCSGGGVFRPDIEDPEYCNADSTTLWELSIAGNHYEPTLRHFARNISLENPSQGPGSLPVHLARKDPLELFVEFREDKQLFGYLNNSSVSRMQKDQKVPRNKLPENTWCQKFVEEDVHDCCAWMRKQSDVDFGEIFTSHVSTFK